MNGSFDAKRRDISRDHHSRFPRMNDRGQFGEPDSSFGSLEANEFKGALRGRWNRGRSRGIRDEASILSLSTVTVYSVRALSQGQRPRTFHRFLHARSPFRVRAGFPNSTVPSSRVVSQREERPEKIARPQRRSSARTSARAATERRGLAIMAKDNQPIESRETVIGSLPRVTWPNRGQGSRESSSMRRRARASLAYETASGPRRIREAGTRNSHGNFS